MRPAPNTATSIVLPPATSVIVSSSVFRFFNVQFELVRERNEQRLAQTDRAGERAKRECAPLLHVKLRGGVARERRELTVGDHERLRLMVMRHTQAVLRFLAVRCETDRDHYIA